MHKVLLQLKLDPVDASLAGVRRRLHLRADQIDKSFGLLDVRPKDGLYAVKVDVDVANRVRGSDSVQSVDANPRVTFFG